MTVFLIGKLNFLVFNIKVLNNKNNKLKITITKYKIYKMSTSTKKFGAVLSNKMNSLSIDDQRIYQLKKRNKHTIKVNTTGINWAKPLKKVKRSYIRTIR